MTSTAPQSCNRLSRNHCSKLLKLYLETKLIILNKLQKPSHLFVFDIDHLFVFDIDQASSL